LNLQCKKITAEHAESAEKNKKYAAGGKNRNLTAWLLKTTWY
jgi:hypothetical protein